MKSNEQKPYKLGIALSGGGARGIAHVGVLKAFSEADIQPEIVAGTSAGAIAGALYAAGKNAAEMEDFINSASFVRALFPSWPNKGLLSLSYLQKHLVRHLENDSFEQLDRPLAIAVSNLNTGKPEILRSGSLFSAIMASAAIPLIFQPIVIDEQTYVDGGLFMNLPAEAIRDECELLIGVNLTPMTEVPQEKIRSVRSVLERSFDLAVLANTQAQLECCDIVIEPNEVINYHIFQFNKTRDLLQAGYDAAQKAIPKIRELLEKKSSASRV